MPSSRANGQWPSSIEIIVSFRASRQLHDLHMMWNILDPSVYISAHAADGLMHIESPHAVSYYLPKKEGEAAGRSSRKKDRCSYISYILCHAAASLGREKTDESARYVSQSCMISAVTWLLHSGQASHSLISCPDYFSSVSVGDNYRIRSIRPCGISSRNFVRLLFTNRERRLLGRA